MAPIPSAALVLSCGLFAAAARSSTMSAAAVRVGLASLTLADFCPTAARQLADAQSALDAIAASDAASKKRWRRRAGPSVVVRWANLVRAKVLGELLGLTIALRAPCAGASLVLLSHLLFWRLGAASARVDALAEPAPVPPQLARVISTADAVVLAFAALGVLGPTPKLRAIGAWLFSAAAALVSAEQIPKAIARRRAAAAADDVPATILAPDELPELTVKATGRTQPPKMLASAAPATEKIAATAHANRENREKIWAEQW